MSDTPALTPEARERLNRIDIRLQQATQEQWVCHGFGYPGEEEPSSVVVFTGEFNWEDIRRGDADVIAWMDPDSYDCDLIVNAPEDLRWTTERLRAIADVMDRYEDWFEEAPEDSWRFQRDLRTALNGDSVD